MSVTIDASLNPTLSASQIATIASHLPTADTFGPGPILAADPSLAAEMQQFLYPYTISFSSGGAFQALNAHQVAVLTLHASLTVGPITVRTSAPIELAKGEDPFFTDVDPQHPAAFPAWLSYDLRFFKVTPGQAHQWFSVPNPTDRSEAVSYIQAILDHLNNPSLITNGDTFENSLVQDEDASALEFLPEDTSHNPTFNFAVARVRIKAATATTIGPVRVFFRLFQAASTNTNFAEVGTGQGTYRWGSNGTADHKIPLLGVEPDQHGTLQYVTIPCFASTRINLNAPADMKTQTDASNARSITTLAGTEVDTYFGCWLDINQPDQKFLVSAPPPSASAWDGPWAGTQSINDTITQSPHQCVVAEIRFDDTPIPAGATYSTSDKLAQRNIAWIDGPNPGGPGSRVMAHPFEIKASSPERSAPDELMITWGTTPASGRASLYLPTQEAPEIIALADSMYRSHHLRAAGVRTLECPTEGVTFVPVPPGRGRYPGLISVELPPARGAVRSTRSWCASSRATPSRSHRHRRRPRSPRPARPLPARA
ncbi:MAG: hypothetical protein JO304_13750 [Solirubrobacterales bacterium]|nr:hypothetical protein [Solirubrobacterales bacterium]